MKNRFASQIEEFVIRIMKGKRKKAPCEVKKARQGVGIKGITIEVERDIGVDQERGNRKESPQYRKKNWGEMI